VKSLSNALGLPCWQPPDLYSDDVLPGLAAREADIIVVVAYGLKLPDPILTLTPHGAINLHPSPLPSYRGAAPANWAIINGEPETGVTTIRLTSRMDAGPILLQKTFPILSGETAGELLRRLAEEGAGLVLETLRGLEGGAIVPRPQDERLASRAPRLEKKDGRIDWHCPAGQVTNLIHGVNPWPGAFTKLNDSTLKIWRAEVRAGTAAAHPPPSGTILTASLNDGLIVAAGKGEAVSLKEIQAEGKKRLSGKEFLLGHPLSVGERFE
jgi:methionyl-tRNA formyltransferase